MRRLILLLLAAGALTAAAQPSASDRAAQYLAEVQSKTGSPAVAVTVAHGGAIVFSRAVGMTDLENRVAATTESVFGIGSVSKVLTGVAVMQLVEAGKVRLDDDVRKYVPAFPDKGHVITIENILTHTSGVRHYLRKDFPDSIDNENMKPYKSWQDGIAIFANDPLLFEPGKYYFYSSYAVNLLQGVVEAASGMPFEDYLRGHVWTPAGMTHTGFDIPTRIVPNRARSYWIEKGETRNYPYNDLTYKFASGGMMSTAEDLARFAVAFNHAKLLKPETAALMTRPVEARLQFRSDAPPQALDFKQALIWRIRTDDGGEYLNHCGTVKGFNACVIDYRDEDLVVTIVANSYPSAPALREARAFAQLFR